MNDIKPWYRSRTIWASIVTVLAAAAGLTGIALDEAAQTEATETILQLVTAIAGAAAFLGRLAARTALK